MWGGDIDARSVFPLAVESSVIWAISREMSSLLAVEATARGRFALRLGCMLPGEGWPSRSGPGAISRPVAPSPASRTFSQRQRWSLTSRRPGRGLGQRPSRLDEVLRRLLLVFALCFCTRRRKSSSMVLISCSFMEMSRMSVASVLSVLAFVHRSARSRNQMASSWGVSPALSLAARKRCRYMYQR